MRPDWVGALHHVMARGIGGEGILSGEADREDMVRRLSSLVPALSFRVFAWVLMPNHIHLLVQTGTNPLSSLMQSLLTGFAVTYNRRRDRSGHVFQGRFKSIIVQHEQYFRKLVRYIHLNPVKAGIVNSVKELKGYKWSGHPAMLGLANETWMDVGTSLLEFGEDSTTARDNYKRELGSDLSGTLDDFHLDHGNLSIGAGGLEPVSRGDAARSWAGSCRVLGSREYGLEVLGRLRKHRSISIRNRSEVRSELNAMFSRIEQKLGYSRGVICGRSRTPELADIRAVVAWNASRRLGLTFTEISRLLCCSWTSVSHNLARCDQLLAERPIITEIIVSQM